MKTMLLLYVFHHLIVFKTPSKNESAQFSLFGPSLCLISMCSSFFSALLWRLNSPGTKFSPAPVASAAFVQCQWEIQVSSTARAPFMRPYPPPLIHSLIGFGTFPLSYCFRSRTRNGCLLVLVPRLFMFY